MLAIVPLVAAWGRVPAGDMVSPVGFDQDPVLAHRQFPLGQGDLEMLAIDGTGCLAIDVDDGFAAGIHLQEELFVRGYSNLVFGFKPSTVPLLPPGSTGTDGPKL